jgi:hemin uptake protein HemP
MIEREHVKRMGTDLTLEAPAEVNNAELAAEDVARDSRTTRRCLRCGGELIVERAGASYLVRCKQEGRVLLTSRGV